MIGNPAEVGTRFDQCFQQTHLPASGPFCRAHPIPVGVVDGSVAGIGKLPDGMMAVGYPQPPAKTERYTCLRTS